MEQVKVGDTTVTASDSVSISTSCFIDADGKQVVLAVAQYPEGGEVKEAKCGRAFDMPEISQDLGEVKRAMKREVLRELVTYLELEGVL
ncbi:MAG: hypothetical protein [Bacteriophage sp.]|nr:MAG: hypothetical protein [Bacteriophage sp.]